MITLQQHDEMLTGAKVFSDRAPISYCDGEWQARGWWMARRGYQDALFANPYCTPTFEEITKRIPAAGWTFTPSHPVGLVSQNDGPTIEDYATAWQG